MLIVWLGKLPKSDQKTALSLLWSRLTITDALTKFYKGTPIMSNLWSMRKGMEKMSACDFRVVMCIIRKQKQKKKCLKNYYFNSSFFLLLLFLHLLIL